MSIKEYRQRARETLSSTKQWGLVAGANFIVLVISFAINFLVNLISGSDYGDSSLLQTGISAVVQLFVTTIMSYGLFYIMLYIARGGLAKLGMIFAPFSKKYYWPLIISSVILTVIGSIMLGIALLPLIIGIIGFAVSTGLNGFAWFLVVVYLVLIFMGTLFFGIYSEVFIMYRLDHAKAGIGEGFTTTFKLLKGHWTDLLMLLLSFIGWYILGIFTFFIAYLWIAPYQRLAFSLAYNDILESFEKAN